MVIRWLDTFFKGTSKNLSSSLKWELERNKEEVAAERIICGKSKIDHVKIGLLLANTAIIASFSGDVYSIKINGRLKTTRKPNNKHTECFCKPIFKAIVIKGHKHIPIKDRKVIRYFAKKHNLPILKLEFVLKEVKKF